MSSLLLTAISIFSCLLQATTSSIWPCRRASPAISNAPIIELTAPSFSFFPKLLGLLIHATKSLLRLSDSHSRLPFISVGVAFVVAPLDELSFASSLMLIQRCCSLALVLLFLRRQATNGFWHLFWCFLKAFVYLWWCPFGCDPLDEWPLVSLLTLTH